MSLDPIYEVLLTTFQIISKIQDNSLKNLVILSLLQAVKPSMLEEDKQIIREFLKICIDSLKLFYSQTEIDSFKLKVDFHKYMQ